MKFILLILIFLSSHLFGEDLPSKGISGYDPVNDMISEKYEAGAWLIYDCKEKHWTCVLESYYRKCEEERARELSQKDDPYHSCATISEFPNKRSCFQRMLYLTTHNFGHRVCVKEGWKEKAVGL
jgi:hypothetical protein